MNSVTQLNDKFPTMEQRRSKLDGSLPAHPVNDRRIANAVMLKSTFSLP